MNDMTEQTPPILNEGEKTPALPQGAFPFSESEVDLNEMFPEEESDLNALFPDEETRQLLKKVQRNKKDLYRMHDRLSEEDWGKNALTDDEPIPS